MLDHAPLIREFNKSSLDVSPGIIGFEDCESRFTHLKKKEDTDAEKYLVGHFFGIQQSSENEELDNADWLRGLDAPADGLTKVESDKVPLLRLMESGTSSPGILRPLRGMSSKEGGGWAVYTMFPPLSHLTAFHKNACPYRKK